MILKIGIIEGEQPINLLGLKCLQLLKRHKLPLVYAGNEIFHN